MKRLLDSLGLASLGLAATLGASVAKGQEAGVAASSAPSPSATAQSTAGVIDPELSALELLSEAESAMLNVDYPQSLALAESAIAKGGLGRSDTARAYRVLGVAAAQAGESERAEAAFVRLFALDPGSRVERRLSPERRGAVLAAKGFWSVRKDSFGLELRLDRQARRLMATFRDPSRWGKRVRVWYRFGTRPFAAEELSAQRELAFAVSGDFDPNAPLEAYAVATDEHGNVIAEFAEPLRPYVFALSEEEQAALSLRDVRGGQTGSFGRRLEEQGAHVELHGFVTAELKEVNDRASFDLHHATALFRAQLIPEVSAEFGIELEHLALEIEDLYVPHAFVDIQVNELFTVRTGFFEAPVGAFNEYLYPDFLRITGLPPLFTESVVPALWSEAGVQARGRFRVDPNATLTYAAFVSNGLEQRDEEPTDGVLAEGGELKAMRFNARDRYSSNKAVGGRLGFETDTIDVGLSGYTGRYTIERARQLSLLDADFSYRTRRVTVRAEVAMALQEVTGPDLRKYGGYLLLAGRPLAALEPYAQYDLLRVGTNTHRALLGVAFYPFPGRRATRTLRLKSEAGYLFAAGEDPVFTWFEQLTTSF